MDLFDETEGARPAATTARGGFGGRHTCQPPHTINGFRVAGVCCLAPFKCYVSCLNSSNVPCCGPTAHGRNAGIVGTVPVVGRLHCGKPMFRARDSVAMIEIATKIVTKNIYKCLCGVSRHSAQNAVDITNTYNKAKYTLMYVTTPTHDTWDARVCTPHRKGHSPGLPHEP